MEHSINLWDFDQDYNNGGVLCTPLRTFKVNIDGIEMKGEVKFIKNPNKKKFNKIYGSIEVYEECMRIPFLANKGTVSPYAYRLTLDNKEITKHPDYKIIRTRILAIASKKWVAMDSFILDRGICRTKKS